MMVRTSYVLWVVLVLFLKPLYAAPVPDIDDRTREIAAELRCVVCQNLSVADSPSEMAQQMRAIVREQVEAGRTTEQIKDFFVSKYGEWVLLKPKTTGFSALLWTLPYVVLIAGIIAALFFVRRVAAKKRLAREGVAAPTTLPSQGALLRETNIEIPDLEDTSPRAQLLRERERLRGELAELDFDFQAGKLSEPDYRALTQEVEVRGAAVLQQLAAIPPTPATPKAERNNRAKQVQTTQSSKGGLPRWQIVSGAVFLLVFGIVLGVTLTNSIRPRGGENDSMTGDFMTGTNTANGPAGAALVEGKRAFDRQEYPKAIEAFKRVLAEDPGHPEAHSYMGFILMQAGHGDGALMAFDKALARAPNFPMALWGKGMVLYQDKKDFAAARQIFEQLLNLMPPGEERNEVVKVLAEIPAGDGAPKTPVKTQAATASSVQGISGKITIDSKIKDKIDPQAPLFIIARAASGAGGPPLAVKKIDKPVFPLDYSLGQENVMMQGMPFTGKINITVRLDKDGNPATRSAGDLTGEYKKNPAEAGAKNVDIMIDQVTP